MGHYAMGNQKRAGRRRSLRKLDTTQRRENAHRWLTSRGRPRKLLSSYAKRYGVTENIAHLELMELGWRDQVEIEAYEAAGIRWEYKYDGYMGEMFVVPVGTPESELPQYW